MWELIRANKRKSLFLFFIMGICLLVLGFFIGGAYAGKNGGYAGLFIAFVIWILMSVISYFKGDSIILRMSKAQKVSYNIHPQLFNVVEEMKIAANLPVMPDIYIIPEKAPNAFAVGKKPEICAIAVTAGLLECLNRDELQGVIAHEISHILNRDVLFMTFSGVLLGSIVFLSHVYLRSMLFTGGKSRFKSKSSKGNGQTQLILTVVALIVAILAPLMARLLYLAISRKREYLADASAVRLTRYPEGLASALEKISLNNFEMQTANKATAALYIANPLKPKGMKLSNLTSTHPPIDERIKILRNIFHGANFINYQNAFISVKGKQNIIPSSGLLERKKINLRTSSITSQTKSTKKSNRDLGDLMRAVNKYMFITCACGLKIKLPPNFKKDMIICPRCGKENQVPIAELATISGMIAGYNKTDNVKKDELQKENTFVYHRTGKDWESFSCRCGSPKQLSPSFNKSYFFCNKCGRKILIKGKK